MYNLANPSLHDENKTTTYYISSHRNEHQEDKPKDEHRHSRQKLLSFNQDDYHNFPLLKKDSSFSAEVMNQLSPNLSREPSKEGQEFDLMLQTAKSQIAGKAPIVPVQAQNYFTNSNFSLDTHETFQKTQPLVHRSNYATESAHGYDNNLIEGTYHNQNFNEPVDPTQNENPLMRIEDADQTNLSELSQTNLDKYLQGSRNKCNKSRCESENNFCRTVNSTELVSQFGKKQQSLHFSRAHDSKAKKEVQRTESAYSSTQHRATDIYNNVVSVGRLDFQNTVQSPLTT